MEWSHRSGQKIVLLAAFYVEFSGKEGEAREATRRAVGKKGGMLWCRCPQRSVRVGRRVRGLGYWEFHLRLCRPRMCFLEEGEAGSVAGQRLG